MENKPLFNFSGGINRKASPLIIKDEECELCINYHFDKIGALTKRKGYTTLGNVPVAVDVRSLYFSENADNFLMVVNDAVSSPTSADIYRKVPVLNSSSTWTLALATDDNQSDNSRDQKERTFFADFINRVFKVTGNEVMQSSSDGSTWNTTSCLANEKPRYIAIFQDRIYAASDISPLKRNRVWYSSLPEDTDSDGDYDQVSWDDTANGQWFDVNPDDNDEITALENNGNRLLIFKFRSMYRWTFGLTEPDRLIGVGAVNQSVVKTNFDVGITFFANPYGVYAYSGNRPKIISRKIQDIIEAITEANWRESCAGIDEDHYYLSVGDIELDGRTISNAVLVYTISLDAWTVYSYNVKPTVFSTNSGNSIIPEMMFGGSDGQIYKMHDGYTDNSNPVATYFRSKEYMLSFPNQCSVEALDVVAGKQGTTQAHIDFDRKDDLYGFGNLEGRVTNFDAPRLRKANSVRFYFTDNGDFEAEIDGVNIQYDAIKRKDAVRKTRNYEDR